MEECKSPIEEIGKQVRLETLRKNNIYIDADNERYTELHPNATQARGGADDNLNQKGKGTGIFMDTNNGGSAIDINGRVTLATPTGRRAMFSNKYNPDNFYDCVVSVDF